MGEGGKVRREKGRRKKELSFTFYVLRREEDGPEGVYPVTIVGI
jgi:hypothetical protein